MKTFKQFIEGIDYKVEIQGLPDNLEESEDFRKKVIANAINDYAKGQKDINGVPLNKIIDAFATKKTYGNKAIDQLEAELGLQVGPIMRLITKVKEELKLNYNPKVSGGPSQAQRVDRYLKQKHIGPRR